MPHLFSNNASATLAQDVTPSQTSLTVATGQGALFPSPDAQRGESFRATLVDASGRVEIVTATDRDGDGLTVVRGQESTVPGSFAAGDRLELRLTAGQLADLAQREDLDAASVSQFKNAWYVAADEAILDHGDPATRGSLAWVLAQVGSGRAEVVLPAGHSYALATDLTLPGGVTLRPLAGAVLDVAGTATLTLEGEVCAGSRAVFSGTGTVAPGSPVANAGQAVLPQWFGARGDGLTDDSAALDKALAFPAVFLPAGTYLVSKPLAATARSCLRGAALPAEYPDWTADWEQQAPTYAGRASVIQYKPGSHGALLRAAEHLSLEALVLRCGQARTVADTLFDAPASHLELRGCLFENLETVLAGSDSHGEAHIQGCRFTGCGTVLGGTLVDCRIHASLFTSCDYGLDLSPGSGLNIISACRFEWCKMAFRSFQGRANTLTGNLFDACEEAAVVLHQATDHVLSGNLFWRNGRSGADVEKRSHLVIKESCGDNLLVANTFRRGGPDDAPQGAADQWPRYILETVSAPGTRTIFRHNATLMGCTEMPVYDPWWNSADSVAFDELHVKGLGNPGQDSDQLVEILRRIAFVASGPVDVHLYESRRLTVYTDMSSGKLRLKGHGAVTLTDTTGRLNRLLGLENITYGQVFRRAISTMSADLPPSSGYWDYGTIVWNANPDHGEPVGWICLAEGNPGTWAGFGTIG